MSKYVAYPPVDVDGRKVLNSVRKDFQLKDFITADLAVKPGVANDLGYYTVKTDEAREIGFGVGKQDSAEARMYGYFKDTLGNKIPGSFKFVVTNQNDNHLYEGDEYETYALDTSATTSEQTPVPATRKVFQKDRRIHLVFIPDIVAGVTLDASESMFRMPGTRYNLE